MWVSGGIPAIKVWGESVSYIPGQSEGSVFFG